MIKNKLLSRSGATMVIALGIFLIAALMSMAIVATASNNANRLSSQRDAQQTNLALSSAVPYVEQLFDNAIATKIVKAGEDPDWKYNVNLPLRILLNKSTARYKSQFEGLVETDVPVPFQWQILTTDTNMQDKLGVRIDVSRDPATCDITAVISQGKEIGGKYTPKSSLKLIFTVDPIEEETEDDGTKVTEYRWHYTGIVK